MIIYLSISSQSHRGANEVEMVRTRSNTEMLDRNDDEEKWVEIDAESERGEEDIKWSTIWGIMIGDCFHNFVGTVFKPVLLLVLINRLKLNTLNRRHCRWSRMDIWHWRWSGDDNCNNDA